MEKFIKQWDNREIEDDGAYASKEWKSFSLAFKNAIKREGGRRGFEIAGKKSFGQKHYFVSGHIVKDGMFYYISYSHPRFGATKLTELSWAGPIMWRRALSDKDFSGKGGPDRFVTLDKLFDEIETDFKWRTGQIEAEVRETKPAAPVERKAEAKQPAVINKMAEPVTGVTQLDIFDLMGAA